MTLPPHLDPRGRHRDRRGGGRVLRPLRRSAGALLSITLLLASGYYWLTFHNINHGITRIAGLHVDESVPAAGPTPAGVRINAKDQNILIVGNDDRSNMTRREQLDLHVGSGQGSNSTDTMMLVHIPADGSRATLISLPRDTWVDISGEGMGKLNGAYVDAFAATQGSHLAKVKAGANKLIDVVTALTGQPINHYVQIGLLGFYRIANALDGVPIDLCHDVDDTNSGFHMRKGRHTLDGKQSLEFVRQRYGLPGTDLGRVRRQQYFLTSAFRQVASVGILVKLRSLGDAIKTSMYFDPKFDILDLARQIERLTANNISGVTIPTTPIFVDHQDALRVDKARVRAFVARQLGLGSTPSGSPAPTTGTSSPSAVPTKTHAPIDSSCVN